MSDMQPSPLAYDSDGTFPGAPVRWLRVFLFAMVLAYGFVAGLHTVADFDLGWQMAAARGALSSTDTFSYTAHGAPWIYPPLAGKIFLLLFRWGGYAGISWFCAFSLLAVLIVIGWRSSVPVLLLLLWAVPALATQITPRSGLFTVVLAAIFVRLLLCFHRETKTAYLMPLPFLMALWVNLHPGFIAGLGLAGGYMAIEIVDIFTGVNAETARLRLRRAVPWLGATVMATFANPWGARIYAMVAALERISKAQAAVVAELDPLYTHILSAGWNPLAPENSIWCILLVSLVAIVLLARQGRYGLALFLLIAGIVCLASARSEGVFLPVAILIGGEALHRAWSTSKRPRPVSPLRRYAAATALAALTALVALRCADIVSDRTSLAEERITLFGAGPSWWLPQEAAAFVARNHLPPKLFSTFNLSSYLIWRLGPEYKDFADGRYLPFGDTLVSQQQMLAGLPLDDPQWQQLAARYNLRTVIFPLSRFFAIEGIPLREDCSSRRWTPVYLNSKAAVFVRSDALPAPRLAALRINCRSRKILPQEPKPGNHHEQMEQYEAFANSAVIYLLLGRTAEAQGMADAARMLSHADPSLPLIQARIAVAEGDDGQAERDLKKSLGMRPSAAAFYQLGMLYAHWGRYSQAIEAVHHAVWLAAPHNFQMKLALGKLQIVAKRPDQAVATLKDALQAEPRVGVSGAPERAAALELEAVAYAGLSDWKDAIAAQEEAVHETPLVAGRWRTLAALYTAAGDTVRAGEAAQRADQLQPQLTRP